MEMMGSMNPSSELGSGHKGKGPSYPRVARNSTFTSIVELQESLPSTSADQGTKLPRYISSPSTPNPKFQQFKQEQGGADEPPSQMFQSASPFSPRATTNQGPSSSSGGGWVDPEGEDTEVEGLKPHKRWYAVWIGENVGVYYGVETASAKMGSHPVVQVKLKRFSTKARATRWFQMMDKCRLVVRTTGALEEVNDFAHRNIWRFTRFMCYDLRFNAFSLENFKCDVPLLRGGQTKMDMTR
ncbi:hypothetical protein DL93DRAFT_2101717 [Clavulina sp. PMI_390]|nr:hypothetical protein DL93DRAFT_2101717 [Clavulina sp. PMI_390]